MEAEANTSEDEDLDDEAQEGSVTSTRAKLPVAHPVFFQDSSQHDILVATTESYHFTKKNIKGLRSGLYL